MASYGRISEVARVTDSERRLEETIAEEMMGWRRPAESAAPGPVQTRTNSGADRAKSELRRERSLRTEQKSAELFIN